MVAASIPNEAAGDYGVRLKRWRDRRRLTQEQLAEKLGYDVSYIGKIEGGRRPPSDAFLSRLSLLADPSDSAILSLSAPETPQPVLPQPPDRLVGRKDAVDAVVRLLSRFRCVTLVGPPGVGKTRLALAAASRLDAANPDGIWWIPLASVKTPNDVAGQILRVMGIGKRDGSDATASLIEALRHQRTLLIIDGFEHVIGARSIVARLVEGAANAKILVTSRESLQLMSEQVFPVARLGYPDPNFHPSFDDIGAASAIELFVARARMASPDFELTEANCESVLATCALLDGIPLAIVLTAWAVKTVGVSDLVAQLRQGLPLAEGGIPVDLPPQHQSLDKAIGWSWRLLRRREQDLLASLSVFSGGFTAAAVAAVAGIELNAARPLLGALCRKSLVEPQLEGAGEPRFHILEPIRQFLTAKSRESDGTGARRARHLTYFSKFAEERARGLITSAQVPCVKAFSAELGNLTMAFERALHADPDKAAALASHMWRYFLMSDIPTGRRWLQAALAVAVQPSPARAHVLAAAGALSWITGHPDEAAWGLDEAADLARQLGLRDVLALVMVNQGALAELQRRLEDAERYFTDALPLYTALGDDRGRAVALNGLGMVHRRRGQVRAAWRLWTEAAALFHAVGDGSNEALVMGNLAWAARVEGRLADAEHTSLECRDIQKALEDRRGLAVTTTALGRVAQLRGRFNEASALHQEALVAFQNLGDLPWVASNLLALAVVSEAVGDAELAVTLLGKATMIWEQMSALPREEDQTHLGTLVARCHELLDADGYAGAFAAGRVSTTATLAEMIHRQHHRQQQSRR